MSTVRKMGVCLFTLAMLVLLAGCAGSDYQWGWYEISPETERGWDNLRFLISGAGLTIRLSVVSLALSVAIGLLVSLPGISIRPYLRWINRIYVEIVRSIPVLVLILWVYYGLPVVLGISLNPFAAGIIALALSDSAFEAEIFRGGIQSIDRGQTEAADALGFSYFQKMRHIVLPQALRRVLPPLGNQFVYMLKMTSLVSIIGLGELTRKANELTVTVYRPLEIYTVLVLEYLALVLLASLAVRWLEKRMATGARVTRKRQ